MGLDWERWSSYRIASRGCKKAAQQICMRTCRSVQRLMGLPWGVATNSCLTSPSKLKLSAHELSEFLSIGVRAATPKGGARLCRHCHAMAENRCFTISNASDLMVSIPASPALGSNPTQPKSRRLVPNAVANFESLILNTCRMNPACSYE